MPSGYQACITRISRTVSIVYRSAGEKVRVDGAERDAGVGLGTNEVAVAHIDADVLAAEDHDVARTGHRDVTMP